MTWTRGVMLVLVLAGVAGCSGGGSGSTAVGPAWEKFRHDLNNTGQGSGPVVKNPGSVPTPVRILWASNIDDTPISASPAITLGGIIVIATEGGSVAALNAHNGVPFWTLHSCALPTSGLPCTGAASTLGPLISSPAVYTSTTITSTVVASTTGSLYIFAYDGENPPTCAACFQPMETDTTLASASFVSSPTFLINIATAGAAGIYVGAQVTELGSSTPVGRLYAINVDGTLKWQFPRTGDPPIAPITSSPAIGVGNTLYFTTDDGLLYAMTLAGDLKWKTQVTSVTDVDVGPSPVTSASSIVTSFVNGVVQALSSDGSTFWRNPTPSKDPDFANSLAIGLPANTPTPTPGSLATLTPTPTGTIPPVVPLVAVVGVRKLGTISLLNAATGDCIYKTLDGDCIQFPAPDVRATIAGPVVSSPALSGDGYIVFGDQGGMVHAVSTLDGTEPTDWKFPIVLHTTPTPGVPTPTPAPIRSSPSVGSDGTIYVGSDDGNLYAVGTDE